MSNASTTATGSSASSQYTCKICDIAFGDNALQRAHAKSEWHIYNLKRSLTSLPAISFQIYNARVASNQETTATDDSENAAYHQSCAACQKHYYTPKSYTNHVKSASHVQAVAKLETQAESSEATGLETIASQTNSLGTFACLFCPRPFSSLDLSLTHMEKSHGFAIPQQEFLFDLPSFIDYLATLITAFQECLYCGQSRDSVSAIKQHMIDKGHCSLAPDAAESSEFEDFYDIPEGESDEEDSEGGKPAVNITILPLQSDASELRLPSGRTLGHRSRGRYFRQSHSAAKTSPRETLAADANEASRSKPSDRREIMGLKRSENANRGIIGISDLEKRAVRTLEKKMMKVEVRARNQYQARVERAANKQKFFKPDVPGPLNG
ncbi:uncharacterized protein RAG0_08227 [Rhynchosporium agropyri]|uniref:C2H2-type domain-containing protein n=1 Tax=Rhynchosporium agropyri TaxID=914238 RepID=A0A1E1KPY4_9HELO|nr:uncharacterized protein RAG0_08227 [Rhynchosporium agropyri]